MLNLEAPTLWPPDGKSQLIGKDPDAGKDQRQRQKWVAKDVIDSITDSMDMNLNTLHEMVKDRKDWYAALHEVTKESDMI